MARFCPECGTLRADTARFCQNCGHAFAAEDDVPSAPAAADSDAPAEAAAAAAAEPSPPRPDDPAGVAPLPPEDIAAAPPRRGLLVGAGLAALLLAGAGLWYSGALDGRGASAAGEAAAAAVDYDLMPVAFGDRCGFVDETGKMVINPQFQAAGLFISDLGLAPIRVGGKWGLIDRKGQFAVNPQFDVLNAVGDPPVLLARMGDKWGIVDSKGSFLVNPQFDQIGAFDDEGRALAAIGGKWGLIDRTGKFVVDPQFDNINADFGPNGGVTYFSNGLAPAQSAGKWGYIDPAGKWVINPQFSSASPFGEGGLAGVEIGSMPQAAADDALMANDITSVDAMNSVDSNIGTDVLAPPMDYGAVESAPPQPQWGYIDKTGKIVVRPQFDFAGKFSGTGLAPVRMGDMWGFIDRTGGIKINPQYNYASEFVSGPGGWLALIAIGSGGGDWRWGAIDKDGKTRIQPQFSELGRFDSSGRAIVKVGDNVGLLDDGGKLVVNPIYARLSWLPGAGRYFYVRKVEGAAAGTFDMGLMNPDGEVLSTVRGGLCGGGLGD